MTRSTASDRALRLEIDEGQIERKSAGNDGHIRVVIVRSSVFRIITSVTCVCHRPPKDAVGLGQDLLDHGHWTHATRMTARRRPMLTSFFMRTRQREPAAREE